MCIITNTRKALTMDSVGIVNDFHSKDYIFNWLRVKNINLNRYVPDHFHVLV